MATGKRYYWLKLKESFMTSDTVDFLMSQKDGANYVVLYQMLCLKTINTEGRFSRTIGEVVIPYDVNKIQRDCKWFSLDTIRVALELYKRFGLVYEEQDGTLVITDHHNLVGSETDYKEQKANQRAKKLAESSENELISIGEPCASDCGQDCGQECGHVHQDVQQIVHTDIRDKILENRDRENKNVCVEVNSTPSEPPIVSILCTKNEYYEVTKEQLEKDTEAYPAVDVMQEYRKMVRWSEVNPTKRKTKKGMPRFIYNWLSKDQNKGKETGSGRNGLGGVHQEKGGGNTGPRTVYTLKPRFAGHIYDDEGNDITPRD
jgi:hypothetical protein